MIDVFPILKLAKASQITRTQVAKALFTYFDNEVPNVSLYLLLQHNSELSCCPNRVENGEEARVSDTWELTNSGNDWSGTSSSTIL